MNYTSDFHLPQWVETDEVRMEDFNSAMAALESALAQTAEDAFRQAHNVLLLAESAGVRGPLGGFARSLRCGALPEDCAGFVPQGGCCWVSSGAQATTAASVCATLSSDQGLVLLKSDSSYDRALTASFAVNGPGRLTRFAMSGNYNGNDGCTGRLRASLYNVTLGCEEGAQDVDLGWTGESATGVIYLPLSIPFRGCCEYRLTVEALETGYNCAFTCYGDGLAVESLAASVGTASGTVSGASARGGLAIVRYMARGDGAGLSLRWNGATLSPVSARTVEGEDGAEQTVAEFRLAGSIPANSTPALTVTSPADGSVSVYGWGAMAL